LAAPPAKGELKAAIEGLAGRTWRHPTTGEPVRFGFSTIEYWYYRALKEQADPVGVLRRKVRANTGRQHTISDALRQAVLAQYAAHKSWSVQLHHDNLVALAETRPELKPVPSYPTLRRFMKANSLDKRRRVTSRQTDGADRRIRSNGYTRSSSNHVPDGTKALDRTCLRYMQAPCSCTSRSQ
jgi:hypothetical protein